MKLRRRIALLIYPEIEDEILAVAQAACGAEPDTHRNDWQLANLFLADEVRLIDALLARQLGRTLVWRDIKAGRGAPVIAGGLNDYDAYQVIALLRRLRRDNYIGCSEKSRDMALKLLAFFWDDQFSEWPAHIPRPIAADPAERGGAA